MKNIGSWQVIDNKLIIDKEKYKAGSHVFKLAIILENVKLWDVVFLHQSGMSATLLEIKDNNGLFETLQLLTDHGEVILESSINLINDWEILSMIKRR